MNKLQKVATRSHFSLHIYLRCSSNSGGKLRFMNSALLQHQCTSIKLTYLHCRGWYTCVCTCFLFPLFSFQELLRLKKNLAIRVKWVPPDYQTNIFTKFMFQQMLLGRIKPKHRAQHRLLTLVLKHEQPCKGHELIIRQ